MLQNRVFSMIYSKARKAEDLPWHIDGPPRILTRAVENKKTKGRVLDLGCGAGGHAIFLAGAGFEVTGIDFMPKAIELARNGATQSGVSVDWVQADVLAWQPSAPFDLILDAGCLHHIPVSRMPLYKKRVLSWLNPGGDFVLIHWGKRHLLDWRPLGPTRRTLRSLVAFMSPEFSVQAQEDVHVGGLPLFIGPSVVEHCFWFQRGPDRKEDRP